MDEKKDKVVALWQPPPDMHKMGVVKRKRRTISGGLTNGLNSKLLLARKTAYYRELLAGLKKGKGKGLLAGVGHLTGVDNIMVEALAKSMARQEVIHEALTKYGIFKHEDSYKRELRVDWLKHIMNEEKHSAELLSKLGLTPRERVRLKLDDLQSQDLASRMAECTDAEVEAIEEEYEED